MHVEACDSSSAAAFLMAAFLAAVAVWVLDWKCAVVSPGLAPRRLRSLTLVRLEAERGGGGGRDGKMKQIKNSMYNRQGMLSADTCTQTHSHTPTPPYTNTHTCTQTNAHTHTSTRVMFSEEFLQWLPSSTNPDHHCATKDTN